MPGRSASEQAESVRPGLVMGKGAGAPRPAPVAVALDAPDLDTAAHWAALVTPHVSTVKIGLELYLRYGPDVVATVRGASGVSVFLDLKLHDIPNTVAGAARAVSRLRPEILTVHAAGGADMIKAAVEAVPGTMVAGVTLLTSIRDHDLAELGVPGTVSDAVRRMAVLAVAAGARGLVCSPQEVAAVRAEVGPDITLITPGIRPSGRGQRRPGPHRDPGRGDQGRRGPARHRPPHHPGAPTPARPPPRSPRRCAGPPRGGVSRPFSFRKNRPKAARSANGVADAVHTGHTGISRCFMTGDMFGVANSTCGDFVESVL